MTALDNEELRRCRGRAFGVAYRMVGTVSDAEDIAQESMARLIAAGHVREPEAFVSTVAARLGIDRFRSARAQRERYVGEWLPEPILTPRTGDEAADHAELADELSFAFLVMLERLSPSERAALVLYEVLGYSYSETAEILGRTEPTTRKLVSRARHRIASGRPRFRPRSQQQTQLVERFIAACENGAVDDFVDLLTEDVVFMGDGGGQVPPGMAISQPVHGRKAVSRLLTGFRKRAFPTSLEPCSVNLGPGVVVSADDSIGGGIIAVLALDAGPEGIHGIYSVVNPNKLDHLGAVMDYSRWTGESRSDR
ncbi:RNA polymerase sigma-70 factor (ECF subfamily) [Brevibacterium sanguinis]|uniref:RNA polymerase sigma-70 factor (ECF subfamily) n=2 Tax=Brevibacterium TaxID=1696 RepID=A0A366INV4_9MICO|nr:MULTISPECIES: sigma-70 family RNA polymerase sigma factor [Brevibacterium]RBP67835.1 RNA polymerase sigma-70 factor (ECF subfamily) [Brevibacterium sanguinis]RBP74748.1 RNA polymerase sigma-70 factor (ECF subfamily) [Brevibacterium celere]